MYDGQKSSSSHDVITWLGLGDEDYVAARLLLLSGFLVQGSILANTAIEKYLKMVHVVLGKAFPKGGQRGHNVLILNDSLVAEGVDKKLNISFLELMTKVYRARYYDHLDDDFNFALNKYKILVGLDETVYKIRSGLQIKGNTRPFKFDLWLDEKKPALVTDNHAFGGCDRGMLFNRPSEWYEMRITKGNKMILATHYSGLSVDDGIYNLDGLRPGAGEYIWNVQSPPLI